MGDARIKHIQDAQHVLLRIGLGSYQQNVTQTIDLLILVQNLQGQLSLDSVVLYGRPPGEQSCHGVQSLVASHHHPHSSYP
jgi:hypothetical protein